MPPESVPELFHHYRILRRDDGSLWEIGRGAMGVTYKAEDTNLDTVVALKVISSTFLDDPIALERFRREARAAASLQHRNVAAVHHLGQAGQAFFYAMEFIDGVTVTALIQEKGPPPWPQALRYALQVARALIAAHGKHLVHRDLKPDNLMLVTEAGEDELVIKVIDFGLAKAFDEGSKSLTEKGTYWGSIPYSSPEQLQGEPLDTRSDIYSLGVVLWQLLAGERPFTGNRDALYFKHLTAPPPWEKLPATLPAAVPALLARMLAKDRDERPQTPDELRREIELCLRADLPPPAAASSASGSSPAANPATSPAVPGSGSAAADPPVPPAGPLPKKTPAAAAASTPRPVSPPRLPGGTPTTRLLQAKRWVEAAAGELRSIPEDGLFKVISWSELAAAQARSGDLAGSQASLRQAQDAAATIPGADSRKVSALRAIAAAQARTGDAAGTQETARRMEDGFFKVLAWTDLAAAQFDAGDLAGSRQTLADARQTAKRIRRESGKAAALRAIAAAQARTGDVAGAQATARSIRNGFALVRLAWRQLWPARPGIRSTKADFFRVLAWSDIAAAQARSGDLAGSRQSIAEAQDLAWNISGHEDHAAAALRAIAAAQARAGDVAAAQETAASIRRESDQAAALRAIAAAQARTGDLPAAQQTAAAIKSGADQALAFCTIAAAQARSGDLAASRLTVSAALQTARSLAQNSTDEPAALRAIAAVQAVAGDFEAAQTTVASFPAGYARFDACLTIASALLADPAPPGDDE